MPEVQIRISADGQHVAIEAIGYEGPACEEATHAIEEALGIVTQKDKKPEYYQTITSDVPLTVRG